MFDDKSQFSFKEILTPISQTLFYFTEDSVKEPTISDKEAIVFLRSCDLHAVKRLDQIYLHNGNPDYYYAKIREHIRFVLIGCKDSFDSCFCVDMGTNQSDNYSMCINVNETGFSLDCKEPLWNDILDSVAEEKMPVKPDFVTETKTNVSIPKTLSAKVAESTMWDEYDKRCINCGRCNFVCPTCTCFTMQDIFYSDNHKVGERRRVSASCMVDGFTDMAGGISFRSKNGQRMRFKVLHKVLDFKQRNGYHMCVGCGRCDDTCPEYISFSGCINKLDSAMKEVINNDNK